MAYFVQQLINGLSLGAIYGLIAIGYTMVYGIIGMVNFAHGEIFMIGAFHAMITYLVLQSLGVGYVPVLLTSAYGWTVERVAYRPLRGSFRLAPLISAIGMSIMLQNYVQLLQGARPKPIQPIIRGGFQLFEVDGFVVQLSYMQIIIVLATIALMAGFTLLITRTALGRA